MSSFNCLFCSTSSAKIKNIPFPIIKNRKSYRSYQLRGTKQWMFLHFCLINDDYQFTDKSFQHKASLYAENKILRLSYSTIQAHMSMCANNQFVCSHVCVYSHVLGNMWNAALVHCECKSDVKLKAEEGMCGWQSLPA